MRWIGIDEAGYGPNLGPLVMTAVSAEAIGAHEGAAGSDTPARLDLWTDLARGVDRAGGDPDRLWIDDSKAILRGPRGRERLELACLALLDAAGHDLPGTLSALLATLQAGPLEEAELSPWFEDSRCSSRWPWTCSPELVRELLARRPLQAAGESWRVAEIVSVVVGPARFNAEIAATGSKADVHFAAFARLLRRAWDRADDGVPTFVTGDKHGGRHYYMGPLGRAFEDAWIDRGPERPELSRYTIRDARRRVELTLMPRADRDDSLVALASIVSKAVRELWMDGFNDFWRTRIPGLRPTAGYPVDARRFRDAIQAVAVAAGLPSDLWWRIK